MSIQRAVEDEMSESVRAEIRRLAGVSADEITLNLGSEWTRVSGLA